MDRKNTIEIEIDMSLMRLGKVRHSLYYAEYGAGKGVVSYFGIAPRNLSDSSQSGSYLESTTPWPDGQIYNAISMGSASGIMLGLKDKLTPRKMGHCFVFRSLQSYVSDATNSFSRNNDG